MFSKLFTTVRVFYITCKHSRFFKFFRGKFEEIEQNRSLKALGIRKSSKTRVHFLIQFTYPLKQSHALVAWVGGKQRGLWSSRICHLNKRLPYIRNYKGLCVWLNSRLTSFSCTWVPCLRRDLLIVILYMLAFNWFILQVNKFPFCCTMDESGGGKAMLIRGCKDWGLWIGKWDEVVEGVFLACLDYQGRKIVHILKPSWFSKIQIQTS